MHLKRIISLLLVIVLMLLCLVSCSTPDSSVDGDTSPNGDEAGAEVKDEGFTTMLGSGDGDIRLSPAYADLVADKTVFDIDNVTVDFYYGFLWYPEIEYHIEEGSIYPYVDMSFEYNPVKSNKMPDLTQTVSFPLKRVEDIMTEKYRCESVFKDEVELYNTEYNHYETLTIPKELFEKDDGYVFIKIYYTGINNVTGLDLILHAKAGFYYVKQSDNTIKIYRSARHVNK